MEVSIKLKWKDYRELFPYSSLRPVTRLFCSNFLVKRYQNRYEGFPEAQKVYGYQEDYYFEGVTKIRWGWFLLLLIPSILGNFFKCLWVGGLVSFPKVTRTLGSISLTRDYGDSTEFSRASAFWNDRQKK